MKRRVLLKKVWQNCGIIKYKNYCTLSPHVELNLRDEIFEVKVKDKPNESYIFDEESRGVVSVGSDEFLKSYGDPFTTINLSIITAVVEESDDKVYLSLFNYTRKRLAGKKYFSKKRKNYILTYHKKTGNFYTACAGTMRCNNFQYIKYITKYWNESTINGVTLCPWGNAIKYNDAVEEKNLDKTILDFLNTFLNKVGAEEIMVNGDDDFKDSLLDFFINRKKIIGIPSKDWFENHYPTQKFLKKSGNNFTKAVLNKYKCYNKVFYKMLLTNPTENYFMDTMSILWQLFGDISYIRKLNNETLVKCCKHFSVKELEAVKLTHKEKLVFVDLLNDSDISMRSLTDFLLVIYRIRTTWIYNIKKINSKSDFWNAYAAAKRFFSTWSNHGFYDFKFTDEVISYIEKKNNLQ